MSLLVPAGLLALLALPAIVILHMRHTKPRLRTVPTLRFWLAAQPEPVHETRWRRPPISLPLILQLLVAAAVAVALAQPVTSRALAALGLTARAGPVHLILLLDGSTSMLASDRADSLTRFEVARDLAGDRLADLREGDAATLLLMGTHLTTWGATDAASLTLLEQRLDSLSPAGGRADLNAGLKLAGSLLLPDRDDQILVLTDGAISADAAVTAATGAGIELIDVTNPAASTNVAVVDLVARSAPANPELFELYARVMSFAPEELTMPVSLTSDGLELDRPTIIIPPNGGAVELVWPLPTGATQATVRLDHTDLLGADNEASVLLQQASGRDLALTMLLVSDAPDALYRALTAIPGAQVTTVPSANLESAIGEQLYDLIVFERFAPSPDQLEALSTSMLFVGPPAGDVFPASGSMLAPQLTRLRSHDPLLSGVDLAGVTFGETVRYDLGDGSEVVGAAEGPLIFRTELGQAPAIVLGFDLARSNLPRRVAFPILLANAVNELAPSALPSAVALGDPLRYRPRSEAATVRVTAPGGEPVELAITADGGARERVVSFVNTGQPGPYSIAELGQDGVEIGSGQFMVNAGHPRESDLRPNPELAETLALARPSDAAGSARSRLADLWPLLVAAALLVLILEWAAALLPRWRPAVYQISGSRR